MYFKYNLGLPVKNGSGYPLYFNSEQSEESLFNCFKPHNGLIQFLFMGLPLKRGRAIRYIFFAVNSS